MHEFLCLYLGLGSAARIFTKLLKVPNALLRRVNIRITVYLDDMLLMGRTLPEILMARGTLIFLLEHLGLVINLKKSVLHPVKQIEFLGLVTDTEKMTFVLSEEKLKHVSQQCQEIFKQPKTSVLNLTKLIGMLSSTVQAILSARTQFLYLQKEQILALNRISHPEMFCKKGVLRNFTKIHRKTPVPESLF